MDRLLLSTVHFQYFLSFNNCNLLMHVWATIRVSTQLLVSWSCWWIVDCIIFQSHLCAFLFLLTSTLTGVDPGSVGICSLGQKPSAAKKKKSWGHCCRTPFDPITVVSDPMMLGQKFTYTGYSTKYAFYYHLWLRLVCWYSASFQLHVSADTEGSNWPFLIKKLNMSNMICSLFDFP